MRAFAWMMDLGRTAAGKVVALLLALAMVFSYSNIFVYSAKAFAADGDDVQTEDVQETETSEETEEGLETEPAVESGIHTNNVIKVTYKDGEHELGSQLVKDGDQLTLPKQPSYDNKIFTGWNFDKPECVKEAGDIYIAAVPASDKSNEVVAEVVATAQYAMQYTVSFLNENGNVITAKNVAEGETLSGDQLASADAAYKAPAGERLIGWKLADQLDDQAIDFSTLTINSNVSVKPITAEGAWVIFDTQGGSYVPAVQVSSNGTIDLPSVTVPYRVGYAFVGWFTDPENGEQVETTTVLNHEGLTTLYAHWTGAEADYTVIYWIENANYENPYLASDLQDPEQYSFEGMERPSAIAGTTPEVVAGSKEGFKAPRVESTEISGDGTTIINVYYDREVYAVQFFTKYLTCTSTVEGHQHYSGCYSKDVAPNDDLKIEAKYDAEISSAWPTVPDQDDKYKDFNVWNVASTGNVYQNNIGKMPLGGHDYYYVAPTSGVPTADYYVQDINGEYKWHHKDASLNYGVLKITEDDCYPITGFEFNYYEAGAGSTADKPYYDGAKFYYDRVTYHVEYISDGEMFAKTDVLFEADVNGKLDAAKPGYEFDGWFLDEACTQPADAVLTGKMPARDITVYAKWNKNVVSYDVTLHYMMNDNSETASMTVDEGTRLNSDELNATAGINDENKKDFLGWYVDQDKKTAYNFAEVVSSDLDLYAKYRGETYTITYQNADVVDTNKYTEGAEAIIKAASNTDDQIFSHWVDEAGNIYSANSTATMTKPLVLTAVFVTETPANVVLTYTANGGNGEDFTESVTCNAIHKVAENAFTAPTGYKFGCWTDGINEYNAGDQIRIAKDSTLKAQWVADETQTHSVSAQARYFYGEDLDAAKAKTTADAIEDFGATSWIGEAVTVTVEPNKTGMFLGYKFDSVDGDLSYTVEANAKNDGQVNIVNVYYVKDDSQTHAIRAEVHYFVGDTLEEAMAKEAFDSMDEAVEASGWIGEDVTVTVEPNTTDRFAGYSYAATDGDLSYTIDAMQPTDLYAKVVNVYYVRDAAPAVVPPAPAAPVAPAAATPVAPAPAAPAVTIPDADTPLAGPTDQPADEQIADDENPLASVYDQPQCWVHLLMILGMIVTAIYAFAVCLRRASNNRSKGDLERQLIGSEEISYSTSPVRNHA